MGRSPRCPTRRQWTSLRHPPTRGRDRRRVRGRHRRGHPVPGLHVHGAPVHLRVDADLRAEYAEAANPQGADPVRVRVLAAGKARDIENIFSLQYINDALRYRSMEKGGSRVPHDHVRGFSVQRFPQAKGKPGPGGPSTLPGDQRRGPSQGKYGRSRYTGHDRPILADDVRPRGGGQPRGH